MPTETVDIVAENRRLLQKRQQLAAEAKATEATPEPPLQAACERLLELARGALEFRREWEVWARGKLHAIPCPVHHEAARAVDPEASVRESRAAGEMKLAYQACARCTALANSPAHWIVRAGVPLELAGATLGNWTPRTAEDATALAKVRQFAKQRMGTLVLIGGLGIGKSHLAAGIMQHMHCGRFITQADLLNKIRQHHYHEAKIADPEEQAKNTRLLVVDELGLSTGARDELPFLHGILNHRHGNLMPTILTGNLTLAQLIEVIGERMYDRLKMSPGAILTLKGQSMRALLKDTYGKAR